MVLAGRFLRLADRLLSAEDADAAAISGTAGIVVGSVSLSVEPARSATERATEIADANHVPIVFDEMNGKNRGPLIHDKFMVVDGDKYHTVPFE